MHTWCNENKFDILVGSSTISIKVWMKLIDPFLYDDEKTSSCTALKAAHFLIASSVAIPM